jgi:hypothetical protein
LIGRAFRAQRIETKEILMSRTHQGSMPPRGTSVFSIRTMLLSAIAALSLFAVSAFG